MSLDELGGEEISPPLGQVSRHLTDEKYVC